KPPSKKSKSEESLKAEVCPWEAESTDKAEICPWEAAAPPAGQEKSRQDKDGLSMVSKSPSTVRRIFKAIGDSTSGKKEKKSEDRQSVCPWESLGKEETPEKTHTSSSALPKPPSKKSQSEDSLKAEVCPWEALDAEPGGKAEIRPWEAAPPPAGQEKSRQDKDGLSMGSRSLSTGQS
ncbi:GP179 protein, partial [Halcyon senegalensis]|nr:GP179 protein [Halcyon senegalensis]